MRPIVLLAALGLGCGARVAPAVTSDAPEVLYLVHEQVWSIRLDGSGAHALGTVGDDPYRTGYPRRLGDGQIALLADDTGAIYPYVGAPGGAGFHRIGATNVTLHDALCPVRVGARAALVYTVTPFAGGRARLLRADPAAADGAPATVAVEREGLVTEPAPWDDGAVLAVRSARGAVTVEILDVAGGGAPEVVATVDPPYGAHAPARLPDGRVVYVRTDPRDSTDTAVGELFVVDRGGAARSTGITGVRALVVVGGDVVYEVGGADGVTDLSRTDLVAPPVNLTNTPYVAEHLGWSD